MSLHQVDTAPVHHQSWTCHIWHMLLPHSNPPLPLVENWVSLPSACVSCRFLTRPQPSADQSLICNPRSIRDRSPASHLVFSGTRSILHHPCACHNMHWMILFRLDSQSTLHSEYGLIWAVINSLDLNKIKNDSGTPLYGHPFNTNTRGYITDSFVCPDKKLINFP